MEESLYTAASSLVRQARATADLTQNELAESANLPVEKIMAFENASEVPELPLLEELISLCGLQLRFHLREPDTNLQEALEDSLSRSIEERFAMNMNTVRFALDLKQT